MGDPSATVALDAYLAKQNSSSSSTQDAKKSRLTRLRKTGLENGSPLLGRRDSGPKSYAAKLPLQDSSQQPNRRSSLRPVPQSQRNPIDTKTAKCSSQQHTDSQPSRIRAVWPPSPLDEKDESPLLEKLHPATPRGGISAASGASKASSQALQRLKKTSNTKASTHPTGTQTTSAGSRNPSHGPAEVLHPSQSAAEAYRRPAKAYGTEHEDQPHREPGWHPQSDATSAAVHPSVGPGGLPQHGLTATGRAAADTSGAMGAHAAVQARDSAAAHAPAAAAEPATAQRAWRRARWDTSQDTEDARLLDSLIPPSKPTHPATRQPDPPQYRGSSAGSAWERAQQQHDGNAAGQPAAAALTGGAAQRMPQESGVRAPGHARAHVGISQPGGEQDSEVQGAVSAARVLEEVLADLRAQEASEASASSPRSTGGGGSVRGNAADLTKAALEEASALDAVVSWYRDVQRQQIDEGLAGDAIMFPLAPGQSRGGTGISPPTGWSKAESVTSPGSSKSAAPPSTGTSPPTIRSSDQDAPLSNLPELPRMKGKGAAVGQESQPQLAHKQVQKQVISQTLLTKISSLAEDMPRLGDTTTHGQHASQEDTNALPAKAQAPPSEISMQHVTSAPRVSPTQQRTMTNLQAHNGAAGNSHLLRDLEELRTKWRDFCEGRPAPQPQAPAQPAAASQPHAHRHAGTSGTRVHQDLDTVWREDGSWAFLAASMGAEQGTANTAGDLGCGASAALDDCCAAADSGRPHEAADPAAGLGRMHRASNDAAGLHMRAHAAASTERLPESYSVGKGSLDGACFSTAQPSAQHLARTSRTEVGSERCSLEGLSSVLDELNEADYLSPFQLSRDYHPMSECSAASQGWQHMADCGAASQEDDLFNALDTELSWDEIIEEFMQPLVSDEMSIIEEFMQPARDAEPSHPKQDIFQHYMQRGQNMRRTAAMAAA